MDATDPAGECETGGASMGRGGFQQSRCFCDLAGEMPIDPAVQDLIPVRVVVHRRTASRA
jgi:hypothetical protein